MNDNLYIERKVAGLLGLRREVLKYLRDELLKKGPGWTMHAKEVVLTQGGLDTLLNRLSVTTHAGAAALDFTPSLVTGPDAPEKKESPAARPDAEDLTVLKIFPNYRLLQAVTATGEKVNVEVKNNANFRPKMKLKARLVKAGRYTMEGRCPRFPGRY
jgi:hypothetical protein